jgi:hypothetical protein
VISESPVHVGTMRSDSRHTLASHGHGGSESTTPWDDEHRTPNMFRASPRMVTFINKFIENITMRAATVRPGRIKAWIESFRIISIP